MLRSVLLSRWLVYILMVVAISFEICVKLYDSATAMGSGEMQWCYGLKKEFIFAEWLCFSVALVGVCLQFKLLARTLGNIMILSALMGMFLMLKILIV